MFDRIAIACNFSSAFNMLKTGVYDGTALPTPFAAKLNNVC